MTKGGYARVSTSEQELAPQLEALREAGADKIIQEKLSGKDLHREGILGCIYVTKGRYPHSNQHRQNS